MCGSRGSTFSVMKALEIINDFILKNYSVHSIDESFSSPCVCVRVCVCLYVRNEGKMTQPIQWKIQKSVESVHENNLVADPLTKELKIAALKLLEN